jgi:hypothetical protein
MGLPARMLTVAAAAVMLAPVLLTASGCSTPQSCAGQCGPPFQLKVVFRHGTSQQAAIAAMRRCQADPLVIRIGRPHRSQPGAPGRWTAVIFTKKMEFGPANVPLLTCLHDSPAVTSASWPD